LALDEQKIFAVLQADEPTHIEELVERLVAELSSSQIFAALFELELSGRIRVLPGKYYVRAISRPLAFSYQASEEHHRQVFRNLSVWKGT